VDLRAVRGEGEGDGGVRHGARLVAFTEAVQAGDDATLARERDALRAVLTHEQFVDACAVIGSFNVVDRIADAIGIPLDPGMTQLSAAVRDELDLNEFAAAANTPGARG
jgi:hypothetical protein